MRSLRIGWALKTSQIANVAAQGQKIERPAKMAASLTPWAWSLARKLVNVFRRHPGRHGSSLHVAILVDPLVRYSAAQAIGLSEAGARVTMYYIDRLTEFDGNEHERARILDGVAAHGITLVRLSPRRLTRTLSQTRTLLRDLRDREVTGLIVQTHFDPRYALAGLRFPTLLVLHDPRPHSGDFDTPPWPAPLVARFAEGTASCLMIHSELLAPQIRRFLRNIPTIVLPHGTALAPAPIRRPSAPVILVAGRLFAYKGVDIALDVFPIVQSRIPGVKLIVAGRGPLAAEASRRDLNGVVVEDGYVSEARLEELLEQSSIVLLPYRDATQSGIGLLAVGRGIPCVVSAQGALPDLLGPLGDELLWSTTSLEDLASAIGNALDKDDSFRTAIYDRAAKLFAWNVIGAKLISDLAPFGFGSLSTLRSSRAPQ
jgi:glycosyltransferase involved in cell wall biosynthesis